jgi:hypothetical protein
MSVKTVAKQSQRSLVAERDAVLKRLLKMGIEPELAHKIAVFLEGLRQSPEPGRVMVVGMPVVKDREKRVTHKAIIFLVGGGKSLLERAWRKDKSGDLHVDTVVKLPRYAEIHARSGVPSLEGVRPEALRQMGYDKTHDVTKSYWFNLGITPCENALRVMRIVLPLKNKHAEMIIAGMFDLVGHTSAEWHNPLENIDMITFPLTE